MNKQVNLTHHQNQTASSVNKAIATHIKRYRSQHKISLDELSRRTGVSKGTLVDLEQAKANPGIAVLCKIAAVMTTSVAALVENKPRSARANSAHYTAADAYSVARKPRWTGHFIGRNSGSEYAGAMAVATCSRGNLFCPSTCNRYL